MILHPALDAEKEVTMELLRLVTSRCKYLKYRRFGTVCRMGLAMAIIIGMYLFFSYLLAGSAQTEDYSDNILQHNGFIPNEILLLPPGMKFGEILLNCGLPKTCKLHEFPVHIYTGKDHKDEPRLCLDGKYILTKSVNNGGRGINIVVVDNMTRTVSKVGHFDTYEKESTALETLLLTLRPGDIIILLTFDEPTRKLSRVARLLFHELGSAMIQNLNYRGSWYLITQKGLNGFSPFESLHTVENSGWPKHHDVRFCVPFEIKGQPIHPDPSPRMNSQRVEFCESYGDFPLFCDADAINEPLLPSLPLKAPIPKRIYTVPVIVISGRNTSYLPVMLETLIRQSGLNPSLVVVFYLPDQTEVASLCDLFGFVSVELTVISSHCEQVREAFETVRLLFPDSREFILVHGNTVLSPDFLLYFGQTLPLLLMDTSILSISAFNENGFEGVSDDVTLLYRTETFLGMAALVRRNFFQKSWCSNESESDSLYISSEITGHSIVPDISRVFVGPVGESEESADNVWSSIFAYRRTVSFEENAVLKDIHVVQKGSYERSIDILLVNATPVTLYSIEGLKCSRIYDDSFKPKTLGSYEPDQNATFSSQAQVLYVHQVSEDDYEAFHLVRQCFGLFYYPNHDTKGLYLNTLRFRWKGRHVIVVGSQSPFYRHKPANYQPLFLSRTLSH